MIIAGQSNIEAALLAVPMELERIRSELQAGLAESINGQRLQGARYLPAGGRPEAWGAAGRLVGWSVQATGGPVTVLLRDGQDTFGDRVLAVIDLADGEAQTVSLGSPGVFFSDGLFLERTGAGSLIGAVWIGAAD